MEDHPYKNDENIKIKQSEHDNIAIDTEDFTKTIIELYESKTQITSNIICWVTKIHRLFNPQVAIELIEADTSLDFTDLLFLLIQKNWKIIHRNSEIIPNLVQNVFSITSEKDSFYKRLSILDRIILFEIQENKFFHECLIEYGINLSYILNIDSALDVFILFFSRTREFDDKWIEGIDNSFFIEHIFKKVVLCSNLSVYYLDFLDYMVDNSEIESNPGALITPQQMISIITYSDKTTLPFRIVKFLMKIDGEICLKIIDFYIAADLCDSFNDLLFIHKKTFIDIFTLIIINAPEEIMQTEKYVKFVTCLIVLSINLNVSANIKMLAFCIKKYNIEKVNEYIQVLKQIESLAGYINMSAMTQYSDIMQEEDEFIMFLEEETEEEEYEYEWISIDIDQHEHEEASFSKEIIVENEPIEGNTFDFEEEDFLEICNLAITAYENSDIINGDDVETEANVIKEYVESSKEDDDDGD